MVVRLALPLGYDLGRARGILPPVGEGLTLGKAYEGCLVQTAEVGVSSDG